MNRLHLDWTLNTATERSNFLNSYISKIPNPTSDELEMMGSYLLWGKNEHGQNFEDEGLGELETAHKTWAAPPAESLDALLEEPQFNEATLSQVPLRKQKEDFNRKSIQNAPECVKPQLQALFDDIDRIDLSIELYELAHGKRTKEIRPELLSKFEPEDIAAIQEKIEHWNQFYYLKQRHLLVEKRREQFTLRDSYTSLIQRHTPVSANEFQNNTSEFDTEIPVFPLGLADQSNLAALIFRSEDKLNPFEFTQNDLQIISDFYWQKNMEPRSLHFDFRNPDQVYQLFLQFEDIQGEIEGRSNFEYSATKFFLETLEFYISFADLQPSYQLILDMKLNRKTNVDIALAVNKQFGKTYSANYISTIFKQRIIPCINDAASLHFDIVGNLFFEENFKKCSTCGQWKLRDGNHYIKKSRSNDGFSARCKKCDKIVREKKK